MKKLINNINHLKLFSFDSDVLNGNILILGNAYGIMPYQEPLAREFANINFKPFWFAFSGQEETIGEYSFESGVNDIQIIINHIDKSYPDVPLYILAHCSGSLLALEYLYAYSKNPVKKLIIYGLMYNMNRRRAVAERKFKSAKVNYRLSENDWNYKPLNALSRVNIPILFCHAKDTANLGRGTEEEMSLALSYSHNADIIWFENGYDIDLSIIPLYMDKYVPYIMKKENSKLELHETK
jgi:hypothetical protein